MRATFGLFDHIEGIPGTSTHQLLQDRLELVKMADAAGFAGYHLAEHHGSDLCMAPNQEIFLAAAAQCTAQIRLGPLVKILPLHHPLRVLEDICLLDQLTGGRVEYGVGRGIAAIEHFWFNGDWFASHDRFDEAMAIIMEGLRTGRVGGEARRYWNFPEIDVSMASHQKPNPPFWYPGNPVVAGRYGMGLMWPGPISDEAYDAYVTAWERHAGDPVRCEAPGAKPRIGTLLMPMVAETEREAKAIAARGALGLSRRIVHVHTFDRLVLDDEQAEAALNPLARGAQALVETGDPGLMAERTAGSGTPEQVRQVVEAMLASGRSDYIVLQLPTGDMTFEEAKRSLELFIDQVAPAFA